MAEYEVRETPIVSAQFEHLHLAEQFQFERIKSFLGDHPYGLPDSHRVQAITLYGQNFYSYWTPAFPYMVHYRIREPETGEGLVVILRLVYMGR